MKSIAAGLLMAIFFQSTRVGFWKAEEGELRYTLTSTLRNEPDRVCGWVRRGLQDRSDNGAAIPVQTGDNGGGWVFDTSPSMGAHKGIHGWVATLAEAKTAVEKDCR